MQLQYTDDYQTQTRGSNDAESLGWKIKTYDEWLNS